MSQRLNAERDALTGRSRHAGLSCAATTRSAARTCGKMEGGWHRRALQVSDRLAIDSDA